MTSRCDVERCADKVCPRRRQCVEETVPLSCPENRPQCRQYIRARCVLPPTPTDCNQISCGPGMFCRKRRRGEGVRCVRARNCQQLTCDTGCFCNETDSGPHCIPEQPTVQWSQQPTIQWSQGKVITTVTAGGFSFLVVTDCDDIECEPGLQCIVLRNVSGYDFAVCVSDIVPTCQNTTCSPGAICIEVSQPSIGLSVGACFSRDYASTVLNFEQYTKSCVSGQHNCNQERQVCMDLFKGGQFLQSFCEDLINCTDNSSCFPPQHYMCAEVPSDVIDLGLTNMCVMAGEIRFEFGGSCATVTKQCSSGLTCMDIAISGNIVGTICCLSTIPSFGPSCDELNCRAPEQCAEFTFAERGGYAMCVPEDFVDVLSYIIHSLLNASDDGDDAF